LKDRGGNDTGREEQSTHHEGREGSGGVDEGRGWQGVCQLGQRRAYEASTRAWESRGGEHKGRGEQRR